MKVLIRILLVLFVLCAIAAGVGYFVVTRPAFQKQLIEANLPEGSSVKFVQITTGSIELAELKLRLEDGTTAKLDRVQSNFSPLAAVFGNTIQLSGLQVDGLLVKLPEAIVYAQSTDLPSTGGAPAVSAKPSREPSKSKHEEPKSPTDVLYALGEVDWVFDIDSIQINGGLIDASRNRYAFDIVSDPIAPGQETTIEAVLKLESKQALQGGLKDFSSDQRIVFTQKSSGGFEHIRIESLTSGVDASGGTLLSASQTLELSINGFEESAQIDLSFNADLPHPEVFAPELASLQGLSFQGELKGAAEDSALTLSSADLDVASNGATVASVQLKQSLTLGAQQKFSGELMEVKLLNLPLAWINPWLSNGMSLSGAPLSAHILLKGEQDGTLEVGTLAPLQVGPFSFSQNQQPLLQDVTVRMNPVIRVEPDQTIHYDLGNFQFLDRFGEVIGGTVSGVKRVSDGSSPLAGLQTKANLDIGLREVLQQPALAGSASILAGRATISLDVDGAAEYPVQLQSGITGLKAIDLPNAAQDFRLAAQLKQNSSGSFALGSNLAAGSESRPSTSIQIGGQVHPEKKPIPFKVDLTAPRVLQSDIDILLASLKPDPSAIPAAPASAASPSRTNSPAPRSTGTVAGSTSARPPWADLDGTASIKVDELTLVSGQIIRGVKAQAKVSESLLAVSDIAASLEEGTLGGNASVNYDPTSSAAYKVSSSLAFDNVDPAIFSKKSSGSFPVSGIFDGDLSVLGKGATLEQALDDSEGELVVNGRNGLLTAFEMDNRSQLGLLGAGILGKSLDRPGITAMAQAVPYFKDMPFEKFTLKLTRADDKIVRIPDLSFIGDSVRLNGNGVIAASSLRDVLDQPLDLTLGLGAKGRLVDYLETLQLLGPTTAEDGFRDWKQDIKIGGTLGDPDTSALKKMLNDAARRAIKKPEDEDAAPAAQKGELISPEQNKVQPTEPAPEPKKKSKEERRREDIQKGVDLLNDLFG